eukprot:11960-Heterococcus_DN1.PRE.2
MLNKQQLQVQNVLECGCFRVQLSRRPPLRPFGATAAATAAAPTAAAAAATATAAAATAVRCAGVTAAAVAAVGVTMARHCWRCSSSVSTCSTACLITMYAAMLELPNASPIGLISAAGACTRTASSRAAATISSTLPRQPVARHHTQPLLHCRYCCCCYYCCCSAKCSHHTAAQSGAHAQLALAAVGVQCRSIVAVLAHAAQLRLLALCSFLLALPVALKVA